MNDTSIHLIYFSPTHTSEKIARSIAKGTQCSHVTETDLTCDLSCEELNIEEQLALISVPVYGGRVAPTALERIHRLRGKETAAIISVVYGNRDYEDALVELRDTITGQGFNVISAGAFVGEHSYSRKEMPIAADRPDRSDLTRAEAFGKDSISKFAALSDSGIMPAFFIKGNTPYKEVAPPTPATPVTLENQCTVCGNCLTLCPTDALFINENGMIESDKMKCIKCCACVKECPSDARIFDTPYTALLHANCAIPREPELFF